MSVEQSFTARLVMVDGAFQEGRILHVRDGVIDRIDGDPGESHTDFGNTAIIPSASNTHTHSFQSLLRGAVDGLPIGEWLLQIYARSRDYDAETCYRGALLSFAEMARSGTTTVADFFYLNARGNDNARAVIQAAQDVGIRILMGRACLDAEWSGSGVRETTAAAVERFRSLRAEFENEPLVEVSPAPHSLHGCSREMLEAMVALADEYDTKWYCHLGYGEEHAVEIEEMYGLRTMALLESWNLLSSRLVVAHGIWFSSEELDLIAERGASISYNPASNMFSAETILNLPDLWRRGIIVGLATDGAASNNGLSMFADARLASLAQKVRARDAGAVDAGQIFRLATSDAARALGVPGGILGPGKNADWVVLDLEDPSMIPTEFLASHVAHAMSDRAIAKVYCAGRCVAENGRPTRVDLSAALTSKGRIS